MVGMTGASTSDIDVAERAADAARSAILPYFRQTNLQADNKLEDGFDPVTVADREAELAMRAVIESFRPDDGILGEEYGSKPGVSGRTWVLDPIDGTRGFVSGTPTWGVLIALSEDNGPILGVIDQPYVGERFVGGRGTSHWTGPLGRRPLSTRKTTSLDNAVVFTTFPEVGTSIEQNAFRSVAENCQLTRYGMDCYAYALLAAGQIDLVIEAGLNAYDIQAPIAVIEAAGGMVTDWNGGPAYQGGRALAAANADIHAAALKILSSTI